jgi:archaellum component FlaC
MSKRTTLPFITSPQRNSKDAKIRFKDTEFDICPRIFAAFSPKFAREFEPPAIEMTDDVSLDTVTQFIKARQIEKYDMSKCNILEFEFVCSRWEVSAVLSEVSGFIGSSTNSKSILIDRLIFGRERNLNTSDIESAIRSAFFDLLSDARFQTLPIDVVVRVLPADIPADHLDVFFEFAIGRLNQDGPIASMLLSGIDISRTRLDLVRKLSTNENFEWGFVGETAHHTITDLIGECRRQSVLNSAEREEGDRVGRETRHLVQIVERRLCELESGQQRLVSDVCEIKRTCDLVLEAVGRLIGSESTSLSGLNDSVQQVSGDVGRLKGEVSGNGDGVRELRSRVEYLCGKFERADDVFVKSVELMKSEIGAGHSAVDHLSDKVDKVEREANSVRDRIEKLMRETDGSVIEGINAIKAQVFWIDARTIGFSPQYELDGVMAFLKRIHGGNVHDKCVVNVTASSVAYGEPKDLADIGVQLAFHTTNTSSQWVQYDFKSMRIRPSHYTLRSAYRWNANYSHPKNWVLEVSETGRESDWTEIDRQTNNADLNGPDQRKSFTVLRCAGPVQFIRLRMIGPDHCGNHYLFLSDWELFGELHGHN